MYIIIAKRSFSEECDSIVVFDGEQVHDFLLKYRYYETLNRGIVMLLPGDLIVGYD